MTKLLVLDAGHGYNTAGKRTPDGIREWSINDFVADRAARLLIEKYEGIEVVRVDDSTGKTDVSLATRMKKVSDLQPDLFISIHHNANTGRWGTWTGVEAYAHPQAPKTDKDLAKKLADKLSAKTQLSNRGGKTADFYVLRHCPVKTPGVLIEGGFMDSKIDHPILTSVDGKEAYAEAIVEIAAEFLGLKEKPLAPQPFLVEIICPTLNIRETADFGSKVVGTVAKGGVYTIVEEKNGLGKLKSGAGWISMNSKYVAKRK